jgi:hypothetical protein
LFDEDRPADMGMFIEYSIGVGTRDDDRDMVESRDELMYIGTTCIGVE